MVSASKPSHLEKAKSLDYGTPVSDRGRPTQSPRDTPHNTSDTPTICGRPHHALGSPPEYHSPRKHKAYVSATPIICPSYPRALTWPDSCTDQFTPAHITSGGPSADPKHTPLGGAQHSWPRSRGPSSGVTTPVHITSQVSWLASAPEHL